MNENFDPTLEVGISGEGLSEEDTKTAVEQIQAADIQLGRPPEEEVAEEEAIEATTPEVVKEEGATAGDYVADTFVGLGAGARDIASNIITTPERVIDFFNGEMEEEGKTEEGYQTEWDQFMYGDGDPIETKTWWGGLVRGATDVVGTIATTGAIGKGVGLLSNAQKATTLAGTLKEGALLGLRYDLVAKNEAQDNLSGMLTKHYGWMDTPFATNDTDHPALRKLKHIVEGMGIGAVFDATIFKMTPLAKVLKGQAGDAIGEATAAGKRVYDGRGELKQALKEDLAPIRGELSSIKKEVLSANPEDLSALGKGVRNVADFDVDDFRSNFAEFRKSRLDSIETQKREQAKSQMKDPGFRAPKNEPIADPWQGSTTSNSEAASVDKSIKRTKKEWGAEEGHVGSLTSNTQIERMSKGTKETEEVIKEILGNFRSQGFIAQLTDTARRQGKTLQESIGEDLDMFRSVYEGRNTSDVSTKEFFKNFTQDQTPLYKVNKATGKKRKVGQYMRPEYIKALDMVNTSLFNDIRDSGIAARELANIANIKDIDGPAQQMVEKLIAGLRLRKISSAEASQQLAEIGDSRIRKSPKEFAESIDKDVQKSIDAFRMALDMTTEQDGDEVFKAMFEGISMADGVHTLDDLDAFMRKKMRGGTFAGDKKKTGAFLREMGSMFTHSVLSGPKTAVRAIMGTSSATFARPMSMAVGGLMSGDFATSRAGLASLNAMREAIPESFKLFKSKLNSYWAGDISTMKTRFVERTKMDDEWVAYGHWAETRGDLSDKLLYRTANTVRAMNDSSFLTYSTKIMASTDDAFTLIIGRARAREKAFLQAAEKLPDSNFANLDAKFFKDMEDKFNEKIFNPDGTLADETAEYAKKEATLTQDLTGFSQKLGDAFQSAPWARPFFLFARTGVNGLTLTAKHTPGLNFLVDEFNQIAKAKPGDDLRHLAKYGIKSNRDLITQQAIQRGRLGMGTAALSMASMAYLSGGLHGNGPTDRKKRQAWMDAGWKPRTIKIGGTWINYDAFEPYNQILALVGDIGDHQELMGEEWAENNLGKLAMALAGTATSKSYLAGLQSFVDLFSGQPGQQGRIIASLMNNTVPLSGLRNEIGKVLTPYTRELGSDIGSSIRNRNLITENIAGEALPIKYDILTGKPIKDHDFITRMFNSVSPVNFNLDYSEGRQLLFDSGYDMRTSTYSAPDGTDLSDSPKVRSMFQKAIGKQNLLADFDKMAGEESIQTSIAEMNWHRKNGMADVEPKSFPHYKRIAKAFDRAKKRAWASIKNDTDVQKLLIEERDQKLKNRKANKGTIDKILEMPK
tara:strand:+ start:7086 stop:11015 length:3930 start_codon:yes stop_codon:yes gene_type:complete